MSLQKVFKKGYMEQLRNNIDYHNYLKDEFDYDKNQEIKLFGIEHPESLLDRMDPSRTGDFNSAIALYEAYPNLSPLLAQKDDLWVYLAHVDLYKYVKQRWPITFDDGIEIQSINNHIADHWFKNRNNHFLRGTFSGLWWDVYLTIDEERKDKYELTRKLMSNQELRTTSFGELPLIRHREAMIGVLEFLVEHPEMENGMNAKARYIQKLFNTIGGYKVLAYMRRDFFKSELEKRYDSLMNVHDAQDLRGNSQDVVK